MTAIVTIETVALILLALLVVGLLRSHAEILRRLDAAEAPAADREFAPGIARPRPEAAQAVDVAGQTPSGDAVQVAVTRPGSPTLLAFLTSGCGVCQGFWETIGADRRELSGVDLVVVTKGGHEESPSRIADLARPGTRVVMSSDAWSDYAVPGAPYFVHVDGAGRVAGEGAAREWRQVVSLFRDARGDAALAVHRSARVDDELAAAGITTDHPSLYGKE
ncbi:MAG TPA: hypothetical protein VFQ71_04035 [Gaiellales bacterium]|nr:hypothetical protein [Gaiellales bacterium]